MGGTFRFAGAEGRGEAQCRLTLLCLIAGNGVQTGEGGRAAGRLEPVAGLCALKRMAECSIYPAALGGQLVEERFGNLEAHWVQAGLRRLVFVIVASAAVDLADPFGFDPAEHLGEHADL